MRHNARMNLPYSILCDARGKLEVVFHPERFGSVQCLKNFVHYFGPSSLQLVAQRLPIDELQKRLVIEFIRLQALHKIRTDDGLYWVPD